MIKNGTLEVSPVAAMGVGNPQEETGCLHLSLRVSVHQLGRFLPAAQYLYKWRVLGRCGGQGWWCLGRAGGGQGVEATTGPVWGGGGGWMLGKRPELRYVGTTG